MFYFCVCFYILHKLYKIFYPTTIDLTQITYLEDRIKYHRSMCKFYSNLKDHRNNNKKIE